MTKSQPPFNREEAKINWPASIVLIGTALAAAIVVPIYSWQHDFSQAAWISFVALAILSGISITAGYHRLWAHRAFEAHWTVRLVLLVFGTMTVQNSVLIWASGHRRHHRHVDHVDNDPYSAKRGFWYSHIGWMLKDYDPLKEDFSNAPDLLKDPMLVFQHKHYGLLALVTNLGIPLLIGYLAGDIWGVVILAGLFRLVFTHHTTFFINSLAHIWGRQPYTDENTARDNDLLAFVTYGEGYHNFHHIFQYDYRNGVKWYQFDPTKWLIAGLDKIGLAKNLKRVPEFQIEKARVAMQFRHAEAKIATSKNHEPSFQAQFETFSAKLSEEYEHFTKAIQDWAELREAWYADTKHQVKKEVMKAYAKRKRVMAKNLQAQRIRMQRLLLEMGQPLAYA